MIYNQLLTISYSTSQTRIVAQRKKNPRIVFVQTYHPKVQDVWLRAAVPSKIKRENESCQKSNNITRNLRPVSNEMLLTARVSFVCLPPFLLMFVSPFKHISLFLLH